MSDRFGYVSRETWWTRYWRLRRRLGGYVNHPTPHDCRTAAILLQFAQRFDSFPSAPQGADATQYLYEVVQYGKQRTAQELSAVRHRAAQARVGS